MFTPKHYAYAEVRNYICAQIAFTKEKIATCERTKDLDIYIEDTEEELETYKKILNLLTDNRKKLTAKEI